MSDKLQVVTVSVLLALVSLWLFGMSIEQPGFTEPYWFERSIALSEVWRLVTTHALHLSWHHVAWNSAALIFVTTLFATHFTVRTYINGILLITVISSLIIYWIGIPTSFGGWSLLVHGWLLFGLLIEWQRAGWSLKDYLIIAPLLLLIGKVALEFVGFAAFAVAPPRELGIVHLAGLIAAVPAFLMHQRSLRQFALKDASEG